MSSRSKQWPILLSSTSLLLLMLYIWIGRTAVPFHGDEADHLFKSHDFVTVFVDHRPQDLRVTPPVQIDSPEHIRLLTGTTTAYLAGYAIWSAGYHPWPGPWYYGLDVEWNIADGRWPADDVLQRGRVPTTVLAMLSVPLIYALGWQLTQSRLAALGAAILLGTHPVWLLNSRRVMQEATLGTLNLLVVLLAMTCAQKLTTKRLVALSLASSLCVAAKPTGAITAAAVFLALGLLNVRSGWQPIALLTIAGILAVVVYIALTPAIWGAPVQRIQLAAELRADVLRGQTNASSNAYDTRWEQASALVMQPFLTNLQYYETPAFDGVIDYQIADYEARYLDGWQMNHVVGWFWTGLAGLGLLSLIRQRRNRTMVVALVWIIITGLALAISIPLAWQRYYLPWSLAVCLLAGIGLNAFYQKIHAYA